MPKRSQRPRKKVCLIIGPIGSERSLTRTWADGVYNKIVKPVLKHNYNLERADIIHESGPITLQIVERIMNADLVIADLTDCNANAFYELGIRHTIMEPAILLMKEGQLLPFDVKDLRIIKIGTDLAKARKLLRKFVESIEDGGYRGTILDFASKKWLNHHAELLDVSKREDYDNAWKDFTGTLYSFNATYTSEEFVNRDSIISKNFVSVYRNPKFEKELHLMFVGNETGRENEKRFRTIMKETRRRTGSSFDRKMDIRRLNEEPPHYEFYIGHKGTKDVAIMAFWILPMLRSPSWPDCVFILHNEIVIEKLRSEFIRQWQRAEPISLKKFFLSKL